MIYYRVARRGRLHILQTTVQLLGNNLISIVYENHSKIISIGSLRWHALLLRRG